MKMIVVMNRITGTDRLSCLPKISRKWKERQVVGHHVPDVVGKES